MTDRSGIHPTGPIRSFRCNKFSTHMYIIPRHVEKQWKGRAQPQQQQQKNSGEGSSLLGNGGGGSGKCLPHNLGVLVMLAELALLVLPIGASCKSVCLRLLWSIICAVCNRVVGNR
jgi:hypothetical protein